MQPGSPSFHTQRESTPFEADVVLQIWWPHSEMCVSAESWDQPVLCCQRVNLIQEDDGASQILCRLEDLRQIALGLAVPLGCYGLKGHVHQWHSRLRSNDPACT